jgi:BirA family transcriptional regulator, biotin operon repressor / biotin---[acetyl-CoA-carboxylase] ligase
VTRHIRLPLDSGVLCHSLQPPWTALTVVEATESTNADLVGAAGGTVLAAEFQQAGRGRLDRSWTSPPRAGLTFSVALRPPVPAARWGWLTLLTGVATCAAIEAVTGVAATLKWPNDVLAPDGGKLAGILAQATGASVVIGVGLNVSTTTAELAVPTATSLALAGARTTDRTLLLEAILAELGSTYLRWAAAEGDAIRSRLVEDYLRRCTTIGRDVAIVTAEGTQPAYAEGIDEGGRLRVRLIGSGVLGEDGEQHGITAADIVHLRTSGHAVG